MVSRCRKSKRVQLADGPSDSESVASLCYSDAEDDFSSTRTPKIQEFSKSRISILEGSYEPEDSEDDNNAEVEEGEEEEKDKKTKGGKRKKYI